MNELNNERKIAVWRRSATASGCMSQRHVRQCRPEGRLTFSAFGAAVNEVQRLQELTRSTITR